MRAGTVAVLASEVLRADAMFSEGLGLSSMTVDLPSGPEPTLPPSYISLTRLTRYPQGR